MVTVELLLIRRHFCTVRLQISVFVDAYVRWWGSGSNGIDNFCRDHVFYTALLNGFGLLYKPFFHLGLNERADFDVLLDKACYGLCKGGGFDRFCRNCVNSWVFWLILLYRLFHCREICAIRKVFSRALLTTLWIMDIAFASGLDSMVRPASQKRCLTASSTKSGIVVIRSCIVFSNLVEEAEPGGRLFEAERFSGRRRSDTPSNASPSCTLQVGVATFYNAASNELGAIGGSWSA